MARIEQKNGQPAYRYSEIFHSFQGEGLMTGTSCGWLRFYLCNLTCSGFGQEDPTDPSTYDLPYQEFDVSTIKRVEDLPVWEKGCDSSYTWSAKFQHLMQLDTASEICDKIQSILKHESNPEGLFLHPKTGQDHHLCFTGGEPMINQEAIVDIMGEFDRRGNIPKNVTVETNGTKPFSKKAKLDEYIHNYISNGGKWFWSCSPKLWSTSGEKPSRAIKSKVVGSYAEVSSFGQLKYVVNGHPDSWSEVEGYTKLFREQGVKWPVFIMACGATKESQETDQTASIAIEALKRGYYFSGRLHCHVLGNLIGT